jgi:GTPase SAR1 family protein
LPRAVSIRAQAYKFGDFYSPIMNDGDFDAKPMVLLIGQYSVGKTSFIRYLLGRDFPGQHIGPEPTTDRFIAVMHGTEDKQTPGNALAVSPNMPFRGLEMFGNGFLSKFQGAQLDVPLLHHITLIDTPGILSGEKQRIGRSYEFTNVCEWFAARSDVILLLFDAHKLDISDEFKSAIESLKGHDDKIRVVLNKADAVEAQKLIRIYGALMWSLGKVVKSPECVRVYIGSFWDQPLQCGEWSRELLQREMADLLNDLKNVPKNAAVRKVNELVKRVRLSKAHAHIIGHLKKEMPSMFGKDKAQAKLLNNLEEHFLKVSRLPAATARSPLPAARCPAACSSRTPSRTPPYTPTPPTPHNTPRTHIYRPRASAPAAAPSDRSRSSAPPAGTPRAPPARGRLPRRGQVPRVHGGARPLQVPKARCEAHRADGHRPLAGPAQAARHVPAGGHAHVSRGQDVAGHLAHGRQPAGAAAARADRVQRTAAAAGLRRAAAPAAVCAAAAPTAGVPAALPDPAAAGAVAL